MPALLELGAAAGALLLLLAFALLLLVAQHAVPDIPVIGSAVRDAIVGALTTVRNALWDFLKASVRPIVDGWWRMQVWGMRMLGWSANALERVPGAIWGAASAAASLARALYNAGVSISQILHADAITHADQAVGAESSHRIVGDIGVAAGAAAGATAAAEHADALHAVAEQDIANARTFADQAVGAESAHRITGDQAVSAHADSLFTTATADLQAAVQGIQADIGQAVQGVEGYAGDVANAAAAAAAAGVLTQVLPQLATITTELDTCLKPLCDTVTPNASQLGKLGTIFKDLQGLAIDGSLLLFIVELLTNGPQVVADVSAVIGDTVNPLVDGVKALV